MKKFLTSILIIIITFSLCDTTFAGEITQKEEAITYTIIVNDTVLDLSNLPLTTKEKIGTVIIPLRQTSEALGYKVDWNAETMSITIADGYIQKAILYNKTAIATFEGKLQIIDMSREIKNTVATTIHDGYTYVPVEFFVEFLNDVTIENNVIKIAPSKVELCTI